MPAGASRVRVACIVVNWNGADDTLACLAALEAQTLPQDLAVFVVDNGSTDDSRDRIGAYLASRPADAPVRMRLIEAGANLGFAGGNNAGIRAAAELEPEFVWLLNNDTVAPPMTLDLLLRAAEATPEAGVIGSVLYYAHAPETVQAWGGGHILPSIAYATHYTAPHILRANDYMTFASVLLRVTLLQEIGLLDDRYFMYYEDAEFCLRAQRAGWGMAVAFATAVLHKEGGSRGRGRSLRLEEAVAESGVRLSREYGRFGLLGAACFLALRSGKRALRGDLHAAVAVVRGGLKARRQ